MVTKEGKEYLEVNLHSPRILTSTRTQGRFGNGHGVEYTEEYFVEYWRPGFNKWVRWRNRRGMEVRTHQLLAARLPIDSKMSVLSLLRFFSRSLFLCFFFFFFLPRTRDYSTVSFIVVKNATFEKTRRVHLKFIESITRSQRCLDMQSCWYVDFEGTDSYKVCL